MSASRVDRRYLTAGGSSETPLLLLHGSDGSERDLIPLGRALAPAATLLHPRGKVRNDGGHSFIRRLRGRRVDLDHLPLAVERLDALVGDALADGSLPRAPLAVGYSSGAVIAAALLLRGSVPLAGAILLRPLDPFIDAEPVGTAERPPVLIVAGADDARRTPEDSTRLADRLRSAGTEVDHAVLQTGHALTTDDVAVARRWMAEHDL